MNHQNFYCISSRLEATGQIYGCFKIGPFSENQSLTFANSLRRTLLSDLSNYIFNIIHISGVEHEFSSLIGVRESVVDLLLNLEKLIFQVLQPITKPQIAFVNFCGPGILRAQDIHLPNTLKCINPTQYIATIEVDGQLIFQLFFPSQLESLFNRISTKIEFITQKQKSFSLKKSIGMKKYNCLNILKFNPDPSEIQLMKNYFFNPLKKRNNHSIVLAPKNQNNFLKIKNSSNIVEKVNYSIQSKNKKEFIYFEVWTNGSLHPQVAILNSMNQLLLGIFPYSQILREKSCKKFLTNFSKTEFRKKFLNLEIGNFYFDLETFIFLKNKKISRIFDFLKFFKQNNEPLNSFKIQETLFKFKFFVDSKL
uniref:Plastid-encoded RNA polymerase subunit alpha n=1 Tax=Tydemania expeditionis TaxID=325645 RepID=A0A0D6E2A5_TYDEX|nr:RNA polymerase alpha subunit [Tydemania expeditionis]CEO91130.1 RNA polymerase alpha subunit [Tydemania expeditionis]